MSSRIGVRLTQGVAMAKEPEQWQEWFHWLKAAGFGYVDLQSITKETLAALSEAGLSLGSFDARKVPQLLSRDEDKRSVAVQELTDQLSEAAGLGATTCFMCLVPEQAATPLTESFGLFCGVFPAIVEHAERLGIKLVLEGYPGPAPYYPTLGCTPEMLRAMFAAVPSPALCVNYDPSHLVRLGIDYIRFLREFADRIAHVHAKDCAILDESVYLYGRSQRPVFAKPPKFSEGPWRYTIPGDGNVHWQTVAFELDQTGYRGPVCIELEDHRYTGSVEAHRRGLIQALAQLHMFT
ncbi:Inosose dehydratase [Paenibacillus solanacearum]|uniref:Inosose dehydratase n=1 Tax=Paenibacillus solanacearum TaxID=2048548 RepID=A0A916JVG0_9BACL|nr:sugar phosphate isomerase/epimerase [Paenibacillus solanacearum]CAG7607627.1 Inosose dehydratase [Paenibacillus solanacearum]